MRTPILIVLALLPAALFAQSFHNGSFTEGSYEKGKGFIEIEAGSTALSGWQITGNIDWVNDDWKASDGKRSIDLSGTKRGSISQTFATKAGKKYRVSFDLAGNPLGAPDLKKLKVSVGGAKPQTYSFSIKGNYNSKMGWVRKVYEFTASGSTAKLTFASQTDTQYGPVICHVTVMQIVPKPKHGRN